MNKKQLLEFCPELQPLQCTDNTLQNAVPKPFFSSRSGFSLRDFIFSLIELYDLKPDLWTAASYDIQQRQELKTVRTVLKWEEVGAKMPPFPRPHAVPSIVKRCLKQCPGSPSLERQLSAGVSKPFGLLRCSSILVDVSTICDNQIQILPDFLPH